MANLILPSEELWLARRKAGTALKSRGTYRGTKQIQVLAQADADRHVKGCIIAFNLEGIAYIVEDPSQLRAIIAKLQTVHDQWVAKGESQVASFDNRYG